MDEKYNNILSNYFKILQIKYLPTFNNFFKTYTLPIKSEDALVIVEPRKHDNLEFVIKNACYYCRGWSLYIFHSKENKDFVANILGDNLRNTHLIEFTDTNITINDYCELLCSLENFWYKIDASMVLIFQTDSYIRKFGINKFKIYDYVGAPWEYDHHNDYPDIKFSIGNGGFSLRRKSKMIEIIKKNPPKDIVIEDLYFSYWAHKMNMYLPSVEEAKKFAVEQIYYHDTIGVHKPDLFNIHKHFPHFKTFMKKKKIIYLI
jgi:hypothetical protein